MSSYQNEEESLLPRVAVVVPDNRSFLSSKGKVALVLLSVSAVILGALGVFYNGPIGYNVSNNKLNFQSVVETSSEPLSVEPEAELVEEVAATDLLVPTTTKRISRTRRPTRHPSAAPSEQPVSDPTYAPSEQPVTDPTHSPVFDPTLAPTLAPSQVPTQEPTTVKPTVRVTIQPTPPPPLHFCTLDFIKGVDLITAPKGCALFSTADLNFLKFGESAPAFYGCASSDEEVFVSAGSLEKAGLVKDGKSLITTIFPGDSLFVTFFSGPTFDGFDYTFNSNYHAELSKFHFKDSTVGNDAVKSFKLKSLTSTYQLPAACVTNYNM